MKIAIIGYSGSGKSTLAKYLGEKYQAEVLYLDTVHWLPGWIERENREEKEAIVAEFMNKHSSWVIDGNYSKLLHDRRMEEADKIIFMSFNRFSSFYRVIKRYVTYKGKTRESITEGCPEKIDFEFAKWILYEGRTKDKRNQYKELIKKYPDKIVIIKNQKQLTKYYKDLDEEE